MRKGLPRSRQGPENYLRSCRH